MAAPLLMMAGHSILELAMTAGLFAGIARLRGIAGFEASLSAAGGLVMIGLAALILRSAPGARLGLGSKRGRASVPDARSAWRLVGLGAGVSILNPYWTVWWLTIGAGFMATAGVVTAAGTVAFYTGHILSDFAWYVFVGWLVVGARRFLSDRVYRVGLGVFAVILGVFGAAFLRHGIALLLRG
jgi:threonine/homoserine/homoserine lactone efflux protein